ncbi:integrase [Massilia sp. WF1]|uniref:tyrosine-type recombinase/integrase n=1 Tax=unclassified Massilia TaxID=2609279 RepID=UPI00064B76A6|nr:MULTISPECIES: integrase arm-type DNA-binding domain-containing protein [unclassified Massilia]ALK98983.1 integrase [Massilia sp. WG5]KLU38469.1 integrase [Massilia sp. WF1]
MPLTDTRVRQLKHTGKPTGDKYTDSRSLHLLVKEAGKYWRMSYRFDGKQRTLALGVYPSVTLAKARQLRDQARQLLSEGVDPVEAKRRDKVAKESAAKHSFEAVARDLLKLRACSLAPSTIRKNTAWLEKNVFPEMGMMPISKIEPRDVLFMLRKIEARGAIESTHKIRQLCGQVFRFAVASGLASRDVTFDLRDALPSVPEVHYAAITEPKQAAALMRSISNYSGHPYSRAALRLAPLFFVRPGVLRAAEWSEFDLDRGVWFIPATKMKIRQPHIVPLARQAVGILRSMHQLTGHAKYVFPSIRAKDRCMSENTINAALRAMGYSKDMMTGHGFRAMARTILDEVLGERVDLIEHQLAHAVRDANGRAYNRTTHLPARIEMMQRWADYLDQIALPQATS